MHMTIRLSCLAAVLLVAAPFVGAETPFTDPVPRTVPGRLLFWMKPAKPVEAVRPAVRPAPIAIKPDRPRRVTGGAKAVPKPPPARGAIAAPGRVGAAPTARVAAARTARVAAAPTPRVATAPTARVAAAPPAPPAVAAAAVLGNSASPHSPKQSVDDRVDPRGRMADDLDNGSLLASKPLGEGAYIGGRHQALVRKYYQTRPASEKPAQWKIGEPVPQKAALKALPDDLRAMLPVLPPGHQYAQLDGEVVLFAVQSRMVVDGVSRVR